MGMGPGEFGHYYRGKWQESLDLPSLGFKLPLDDRAHCLIIYAQPFDKAPSFLLPGMTDETTHIEQLFRGYDARLCYFATRLTGDAERAEDIVQEAFLNYWKTGPGPDGGAVAKSYLYTAVRNACLNDLRHLDVRRRHGRSILPEDLSTAPVIDEIVRAELLGELLAAIKTLPVGCRTVLRMAYFEKLGNDEIARLLDVSVNTVKTQKMRALRLLRRRLDPLTVTLFLYATYKDRGFEIIGIANEIPGGPKPMETQLEKWRKAVADDGIHWKHVLYDPSIADLVKQYDINGYPTKFLVGRDGRFILKILGNSPQGHEQLSRKLEELLPAR